MVFDVNVGRLGCCEFRGLSLGEALPDLVALEGVVHEECCEFLVVVVVVGAAAI